jgi:hypothetical protein
MKDTRDDAPSALSSELFAKERRQRERERERERDRDGNGVSSINANHRGCVTCWHGNQVFRAELAEN